MRHLHVTVVRIIALLFVLAFASSVVGCGSEVASEGRTPATPAPAPEPDSQPAAEEPSLSSYVIYINDDDSYDKDGITYSIALNLTATNPTGDIAGDYSGEATAKTDSVGEYRGQQLNASATAKSTTLEFTVDDPTAGGALAPLTEDAPTYTGSGNIVMKASGSGTYGQAGGSFGNTSGQNLKVTIDGTAVTLKVTIDGHTYTFDGTIEGK